MVARIGCDGSGSRTGRQVRGGSRWQKCPPRRSPRAPAGLARWVQVTVPVLLLGFFVIGFLAFRVYEGAPPIADRVVSEVGDVLFAADEVHAGQAVFLERGLMQYGTILGHGAYLGEDFTAD